MNIRRPYILTINAGSSSIKFALFTTRHANGPRLVFDGQISGIGWPMARVVIHNEEGSGNVDREKIIPDYVTAIHEVALWLKGHVPSEALLAIGHRIVHGGPHFTQPTRINETTIALLQKNRIFDPLHLPDELDLIDACSRLFPGVNQIACFDTAFHHTMPRRAQLFALPRRYEAQGLRRYGFHGLSCQSILHQLKERNAQAANGRIIIAHLGNGASLTAVVSGKSIETTMALTPAAGIPMSTRSGDIDPGIVRYLARHEGLTVEEFDSMINTQSGLLGVSGLAADMKTLLEAEDKNENAKEAADLFCYSVKKQIGALSAAMGGVDEIIFTGGIGENAPKVRARACEGLEFLGIQIDSQRNEHAEEVISADGAHVMVRVLHTNETQVIAEEVWNSEGIGNEYEAAKK